jgi:DNA-binding transcriptional LysR family regulator
MLDPKRIARTFTLRTREGFVETFGPALIAKVGAEAPQVRLHFVQKPDKDSASLRDGIVDMETGVVGAVTGPEIRAQALFRDRFVGVVRDGHPLSRGKVTPIRFAKYGHVIVSRRGPGFGPIDEALKALRLERRIVTLVGSFSTALALAKASDLVASVPERHTGVLRQGMHTFPLPIPTPEFTLSLLWHPRLDADPAHRWLRECIREVCSGATVGGMKLHLGDNARSVRGT